MEASPDDQLSNRLSNLSIQNKKVDQSPSGKQRKASSSRVALTPQSKSTTKKMRFKSPISNTTSKTVHSQEQVWKTPTKTPSKPLSAWGAYVAALKDRAREKYPDLTTQQLLEVVK